jgi:hypothetical protein
MSTSINIIPNDNVISVQDSNNQITITSNTSNVVVDVTQPITNTVQVLTGLQGQKGDQGPVGPSGSSANIDTGSLVTTSSFNSFTSSYTTDSSSFNSRIGSLTAATSSYVLNSQTSSMTVLSASFARTASFLPVGTYAITSSNAVSSSYSLTASYVRAAGNDTYVQYNSNGDFAADSGLTFNYTSQGLQQGDSVNAIGVSSHAEGGSTQAIGDYSHAEGSSAQAIGAYSHAEGNGTKAIGEYSHAEGFSAQAIGILSHAEGVFTTSNDLTSHTEGISNTVLSGSYIGEAISGILYFSDQDLTAVFPIGTSVNVILLDFTTGQAYLDISIIDNINWDGSNTIIELQGLPGPGVDGSIIISNIGEGGAGSHAEGIGTTVSAPGSHTEGLFTTTLGLGSHAEGLSTKAIGPGSHAEGSITATGTQNAYYAESVSSGIITLSSSYADVSGDFGTDGKLYLYDEPFNNTYGASVFTISQSYFDSANTIIELYDNSVTTTTAYVGDIIQGIIKWQGDQIIPGFVSHAEGSGTQAIGEASHAEGDSTQAIGEYSHAEGSGTQAIGEASHAEGLSTQAIGEYSHAEGGSTQAIGAYSHAEGNGTKAIGEYSHAEGDYTQAIGDYSHAEGQETIASGSYSHAEGYQTISSANRQHVQGQWNAASSVESAFIVGNGTDDGNRSNLIHAAGNEVQISGSVGITNLLTLTPQHPLPSQPPTGSFAVSSSVPPRPFFWNGTSWNALY